MHQVFSLVPIGARLGGNGRLSLSLVSSHALHTAAATLCSLEHSHWLEYDENGIQVNAAICVARSFQDGRPE